jgi:REP element-mobilizing transposase RayT
VFFGAEDYCLYRRLIATAARRANAEIWAYCLMPNHVHLIVTPSDQDGLRATFAEAHRRYTGAINARFHWTGRLFQSRFGAVVMDEPHLLAAARYIALNPVAAGLVSRAEAGPWSSARAHLTGEDDELAIERRDPFGCPKRSSDRGRALDPSNRGGSAEAARRAAKSGISARNGATCEGSSKLSPQP